MNKGLFFGLLPVVAALAAAPARAQSARADSSLVAAAGQALTARYAAAVGEAARLYNGPEYVPYVGRNANGHPFYGSGELLPASITYDGYTYREVPLRYDLARGQLVLRAPGGGLLMSLLNERVQNFELAGHTFVRLVAADASQGLPAGPGYYDLLVDGPVRLLGVHRKTVEQRSTFTGISTEITARDQYFVEQGRRYYPVSKASTVLRLFPAQKAALRQFVRDHRLDFGPAAREASLTALLRYQATLPAQAPR